MTAVLYAHRYSVLALMLVTALFAHEARGGDIASILPNTSELKFDQDKNAKAEGRLVGKGFHEYTFTARKGQQLAIVVLSDVAPWLAIDLLPPVFASAPSMRPAVYSNFIDGTTSWKGTAPESGMYTVRVALLHADAKRASKVEYELDVALR
jgi:hypothetical protein